MDADEGRPPPLSPPGWYLDPDDAGQRQYWDGGHWTDQRLPIKPRRKPLPWWVVLILSLIAVVVLAAIFSIVL